MTGAGFVHPSRPGHTAAPDGAKRYRRLLFGLVLISFALYLWRIDAKSIWWDESLSLFRAQRSISYILSNRIDFPGLPTTDQHPPLYFLLLHCLTRLCGESDLVLRFPSAAFATLIVPLLYVMGCRLRGPRVGLLAALLGVLSPFHLWYAQEARMYTMVTALGLFSLYCLWRAVTEQKRSWVAGFFSAALASAITQYFFALALICQGMLALFLWPGKPAPAERSERKRSRLGRYHKVALYGGAAISLLVLAALGYEAIGLIPTLANYQTYVPLSIMLRDVLNSFSLGLSVNLRQAWPLDVLFFFVFLAGVISIWKYPPHLATIRGEASVSRSRGAGITVLVGCIAFPLLAMWVFSLFVPIYKNSRYAIISSPAFYLGIGLGLDALFRWKRVVAWLLLATLLAGMGWSITRYFTHDHYRTREDYRSAAQFIASNERVGDLIIVNGPESLPAFMHYYAGCLPVVGLPEGGWSPERVADELETIARSYDRLWLVRARTKVSDPNELVRGWMGANAMRLMYKGYPSCGYYLSTSSHLSRSPTQVKAIEGEPLGAFGDRLALLDYTIRYLDAGGEKHEIPAHEARAASTLSKTNLETPVSLGHRVSAVVFWQPLRKLGDYKTSLRLVKGSVIWEQRDQVPFMYFPTDRWPVGETVRYESDLPIPPGTPPGAYDLQFWVYDAQSKKPLMFHAAATGEESAYITLGRIVVGDSTCRSDVHLALPTDVKRAQAAPIFGRRLALLAYDVAPASVVPGETLMVRLYWQGRKAMQRDYQVVLNWQDSTGQVWYTTTHSPTGTDYPTSRWSVGETFRGLLQLTVPQEAPPGRHRLHLLVHAPDGQSFLWLWRGIIPWFGRDLQIADVTIAQTS